MTPQGSLGMQGNAGMLSDNSASLYNSISSAGAPEQLPQESMQPTEPSPAEKFIIQFGSVFTPFLKFMESYPQASPQADDVKKSIEKWMSAVSGQLPQGQGGESTSL